MFNLITVANEKRGALYHSSDDIKVKMLSMLVRNPDNIREIRWMEM